jgi:hypothetical protein
MYSCTSNVTNNVPVCAAAMEAALMFQGVDCWMPPYLIDVTLNLLKQKLQLSMPRSSKDSLHRSMQ